MARTKTAAEVEVEYLESFGPELGRELFPLCQDFTWLNWKWAEFKTLFGTKPSRIELLNQAAPAFFRLLQGSLWDDVVLHLCRLTDPPRSAGKHNLTVRRLPRLVEPELKPKVDELLATVEDRSEFARDWRRRHIAHRDLALATDEAAKPLATASRLLVNQAIESVGAVLNCVHLHYRRATVHYEVTPHHGNAEDLLYVLRDGIELERQRRERHKTGRLLPEDLAPWPAV